ncbi:MAG: nitroreductase family protein [Candidatus Heimdallarchaeota archaeon]
MSKEFISFKPKTYASDEMHFRSKKFYEWARTRRTVRKFSTKPVPRKIIETIVKTAGTAPSGANKQPWTFVVVSDPSIKSQIRVVVEAVEKEFYESRISDAQRKALAPLATDWQKPYLTEAPYLIVVFRQDYAFGENMQKLPHYYVKESVGIAVGMLIMAIHNAGLVTVTHTPAPMKVLKTLLNRPPNEKPYVLMPVGYPHEDAKVPNIGKKSLSEIAVFL